MIRSEKVGENDIFEMSGTFSNQTRYNKIIEIINKPRTMLVPYK